MGLFDFLRKDERAIPEPGTPEFEQAVSGSAIPDSQSVDMGRTGWASTSAAAGAEQGTAEPAKQAPAAGPSRSGAPDEGSLQPGPREPGPRGGGAREEILNLMREKGLDPDQPDAAKAGGLREGILDILKSRGVVLGDGAPIPPAGGHGGWVGSDAAGDTAGQLEHLQKQLDAGRITQAEFEAQKRSLTDG